MNGCASRRPGDSARFGSRYFPPTSYQFLGQKVRDLSSETTPAATTWTASLPITAGTAAGAGSPLETATPDPAAPPLIVSALAAGLYSQLYIRPGGVARTAQDMLAQRDFVAALSAANAGEGAWESGWRTGEVDDAGQVAVAKDGLTFWAPPTGLRTNAEDQVRARAVLSGPGRQGSAQLDARLLRRHWQWRSDDHRDEQKGWCASTGTWRSPAPSPS